MAPETEQGFGTGLRRQSLKFAQRAQLIDLSMRKQALNLLDGGIAIQWMVVRNHDAH